jgi:hypothetical protein
VGQLRHARVHEPAWTILACIHAFRATQVTNPNLATATLTSPNPISLSASSYQLAGQVTNTPRSLTLLAASSASDTPRRRFQS